MVLSDRQIQQLSVPPTSQTQSAPIIQPVPDIPYASSLPHTLLQDTVWLPGHLPQPSASSPSPHPCPDRCGAFPNTSGEQLGSPLAKLRDHHVGIFRQGLQGLFSFHLHGDSLSFVSSHIVTSPCFTPCASQTQVRWE